MVFIMDKQIIRNQYCAKLDQLIDRKSVNRPNEGWIRVFRKALGMSGPQLAQRLGVSKAQVSQMERMEMEDRITLKQLRRVAEVLNCDLEYSLVPRKPMAEMVLERAGVKARQLVNKVDTQMRLEAQQLSAAQLNEKILLETDRLMRRMPRDLWQEDVPLINDKVNIVIAEEIVVSREELEKLAQRHNIKHLALFGSAARGQLKPDSDIDLLVEFEKGKAPSLGGMVKLKDELSALFAGRKVDIATPNILNNPYRRRAIEKDMEDLYAA